MTTEQRSGFRLPWSSERAATAPTGEDGDANAEASNDDAEPVVASADTSVAETATRIEADDDAAVSTAVTDDLALAESDAGGPDAADGKGADPEAGGRPEWPEADMARAPGRSRRGELSHKATEKPEDAMPIAGTDTTTAARRAPGSGPAISRPVHFLAEMSRAMLSAAQAARDESLAGLAADAKQRIEEIQERGTTGTTELRRKADDDVAATREWSKSEIARIREETERRIAERKSELEADVEGHVATIKRRTELVRERVSQHEAQLAAFMDRLLGEDNPARIATLAQEAPEPPVLDDLDDAGSGDLAPLTTAAIDDDDLTVGAANQAMEQPATTTAGDADDSGDAAVEPVAAEGMATTAGDVVGDDAWQAAEVGAEASATSEDQPAAESETPSTAGPELSAAGAAAAEAEAMSGLESRGDRARAAGAGVVRASVPAGGVGRTELLVAGLASVAGIAGFKRELSRLPGVRSVGVSAGEAGEFLFAVSHDPDTDLATEIPTIVAFGAQVGGRRNGSLLVSAMEPATAE